MLMGKQFYSVPFTTSKLVSSLPYKFTKLDERLSSHFCLQLIHLPVLPYSSTYLSLKKCFKSMIIFSWKIFTHAWELNLINTITIVDFHGFQKQEYFMLWWRQCFRLNTCLLMWIHCLKLLLFLKKYEVILKKTGVSIMDWWKSTQHAFINT